MKLSHYLTYASLALGSLLISTSESRALKMLAREATNSTIQRASQAEVIVLGTITALESDILKISQVSGGPKVNYMVAVVKVQETFLGTKGVTHLRVGFVPNAQTGGYYGEEVMVKRRMAYRSGNYSTSLQEGQEACFFLVKHHEGDFYTLPQYSAPLNKSHLYFDDELDQVKKVVDVLQNPILSLKAKESTDRQFAAGVLLQRYRTAPQANGTGSSVKTDAVGAEESKLILTGLGEMTWGDMGVDGQGTLSIQSLFWQLSLTDKEGWRQPAIKEDDDYNAVMDNAVKKWIKENNSKYRLQRFVLERKKTVE